MTNGWAHVQPLEAKLYICGHCGNKIAADKGYPSGLPGLHIRMCPVCDLPTLFDGNQQVPGVAFGDNVGHLPAGIKELYAEARRCCSINAFTSSVLASRKLLMHIGVEQGAKPNRAFAAYVEHLAEAGYVPPNGKAWVDVIRTKGNEANHEIQLMSKEDAELLLSFLEMLLRFIYEFPKKIPGSQP